MMNLYTIGITTLRANRTMAYNCDSPGTKIVFTCVVTTTDLSWDIDFLNSPDIERILYVSDDPIGLLQSDTSHGLETRYNFNLTSKSPLTSTMTTIASTDLSGVTISCRDGFTSSAHIDTLVIEITPGTSSV